MNDWLDKIEERLKAATPGPFSVERRDLNGGDFNFIVYSENDFAWCLDELDINAKNNAEFIAHATTDIARLLKAHKIMREALEKYIGMVHYNPPDGNATMYARDALAAVDKLEKGE